MMIIIIITIIIIIAIGLSIYGPVHGQDFYKPNSQIQGRYARYVHLDLNRLPNVQDQKWCQGNKADHIGLQGQGLLMVQALVEQAFQHEQKMDIPNFMTDVQDLGNSPIAE